MKVFLEATRLSTRQERKTVGSKWGLWHEMNMIYR